MVVVAAGSSPSGQRAIPPEGPHDAALVLIGESPAGREVELGRPFVGRAGKALDAALAAAALPRSEALVLNAVPVRAPSDEFAQHSAEDLAWGTALLREALETNRRARAARGAAPALLVPLGDNPLRIVCGLLPIRAQRSAADPGSQDERSRIGAWRGSLLPLKGFGETYRLYVQGDQHEQGERWAFALPTYHPAAVARRYEWHALMLNDLKRARRWLDGKWQEARPRRFSYTAPPDDWIEQILEGERMFALDSEQEPELILAVASEEEVYSFAWSDGLRARLQPLFSAPHVVLAAHNAAHDFAFLRWLGFDVANRVVDTGGLAHIACNALPRSLSPGLTARYTPYPYHKWLVDYDPLHYCAIDTLACHEGYWGATREVCERGLLPVSEHDHRLLRRCMAMQERGVLVDDEARRAALAAAQVELEAAERELREFAEPVVRSAAQRFQKPHLFVKRRQCSCCGGGAKKAARCWSCVGFKKAPSVAELRELALQRGYIPMKGLKKADLESRILDPCQACNGVGSFEEQLDWKWDGPALNELLYRGLGIPARSFKGRESRRSDQLEVLLDASHLDDRQKQAIRLYLRCSQAAQERNEMEQLAPDLDGRLHSQFDPWGTASGRVASRESLLQRGRNMQNIPRKYRNVIIADPGCVLFAPDMEQIEARCVAVLSKDAQLARWFVEPVDWSGSPKHGKVDQHSQLQKLYWQHGVRLSRDQVKRSTYAFTYGGEAHQVALELTKDALSKGEGIVVSEADAAKIRGLFYSLLPGVKRWQYESSAEVARTRKLKSPTGRDRWWLGYITQTIPANRVRPTDYVISQFDRSGRRYAQILGRETQKELWSFAPQDMGAWILAEGLERLAKLASERSLSIEQLLHVHDEVVLQVPAERAAEAASLIKQALTVELWGMVFECSVGQPARSWREAKAG